ncbi:hypothetical protein BGZ63DRAFT_418675 [Mariannaea sp. PMI_226]|nr:hypothetical protein BGZ63DRAFT_418675 [Mariannaea sp. PMI_226]
MKGQVSIGPDATQWYGSLCVDNLRDDKDGPIPIKKYIAITFKSPSRVQPEDLLLQTSPWRPIQPEVESVQIDPWTFVITACWRIDGGCTFTPHDAISININGDLLREINTVKKSFRVAVDRIPGEKDLLKA